jgi:hypothetical protein
MIFKSLNQKTKLIKKSIQQLHFGQLLLKNVNFLKHKSKIILNSIILC